jgi:hypothetical protein
MSEDLNHVKTDIALIKKDIQSIGKFFDKVDAAVEGMQDIAKSLAVQQQIMENFQQKIEYMDERLADQRRMNMEARLAMKEELDEYKENFKLDMLKAMEQGKEQHHKMAQETKEAHERRHAETLAIIDNIVRDVKDKVNIQEQQIRSLENLKWWLLGAFAIITFILNYADLSVIFQK